MAQTPVGGNSYQYSYDEVGNQTIVNTERKFEWDAANRLLFFKNQVGSSEPTIEAQYLYDHSGNRVKKIVRKQGGGYEIRIYIDGVFEYFTDETEEQNTVHIMDDKSRIATIRIGPEMGDSTPAVKYVLDNNIGSSLVTLDGSSGAVVNEQEYYPFGETSYSMHTNDADVSLKRYKYVHKELDTESGLYYYGARYYAAWLCRFVSVDPLKDDYPYYTTYQYAGNKPIIAIDLDGLEEYIVIDFMEGDQLRGRTISRFTKEDYYSRINTERFDNELMNLSERMRTETQGLKKRKLEEKVNSINSEIDQKKRSKAAFEAREKAKIDEKFDQVLYITAQVPSGSRDRMSHSEAIAAQNKMATSVNTAVLWRSPLPFWARNSNETTNGLNPRENELMNVNIPAYLAEFTTAGSTSNDAFSQFMSGETQGINIVFPSQVRPEFESGEYSLTDQGKEELDKLAIALTLNPEISIQLIGHTDDVGTAEDNQVLSEQRARASMDYLISRGISADRITTYGMGETSPLVPNTDEASRQTNRRVQIIQN